jgi:hypothetical protein
MFDSSALTSAEVVSSGLSFDSNVLSHPAVAANRNTALVVWDSPTNGNGILGRLFDDATNSFDTQVHLIAYRPDQPGFFSPDVAAIGSDRYAVVYTDGIDVWATTFDPSTPGGPNNEPSIAMMDRPSQADSPGGNVTDPHVYGTVDGGFIVTWDDLSGGNSEIHARRFDAHAQPFGNAFIVNSLTDGNQIDPVVAVSGAEVLFAWEDYGSRPADASPPGIRGQTFSTSVFDYDKARYGDLNNDGRADILFENENPWSPVAIWQTNGSGALSTITSFVKGASFLIEGTGNFNSTPGSDILVRT